MFQRSLQEPIYCRPHQFLALHGRHGWLPRRQKGPVLFRVAGGLGVAAGEKKGDRQRQTHANRHQGEGVLHVGNFMGAAARLLAYVRFQRLDRRVLVAGAKDLNELLVLLVNH